MTQTKAHEHGFHNPAQDAADYLDTQTMGGGDGYFHTGASRGHATTSGTSANVTMTTDAPADDYEGKTNAQLTTEAKARGLTIPKQANKAQLVKLLRGE